LDFIESLRCLGKRRYFLPEHFCEVGDSRAFLQLSLHFYGLGLVEPGPATGLEEVGEGGGGGGVVHGVRVLFDQFSGNRPTLRVAPAHDMREVLDHSSQRAELFLVQGFPAGEQLALVEFIGPL